MFIAFGLLMITIGLVVAFNFRGATKRLAEIIHSVTFDGEPRVEGLRLIGALWVFAGFGGIAFIVMLHRG
ncbi:hypothetical protein [Streptomyces sp. JJ38]|uniref:hypothetical protein n=1 Tax=Streptomyces sp. JJ38 TaxID=2738128 RepID=UPI001C56F870|nr:hypothetical protein [Streptomyces sp. JJ38]MBW1596656.1 hypothetical protein [Streptomyces sp. JJ38]